MRRGDVGYNRHATVRLLARRGFSMTPSRQQVTQLLLDWSKGDKAAFERLMPLVYQELRRLAHRYMRLERPGHMLQTTDLVHEAYLRLADYQDIGQTRAHFFALAAQLMRRILV